MNAGDTIKVRFYGPMLPAFSMQQIGNALGGGLVDDTPNAFVWEIGHTSPFTNPAAQFCVPGQTFCDSYYAAHLLDFSPLQIKSVTFANGFTASKWAVVSSQPAVPGQQRRWRNREDAGPAPAGYEPCQRGEPHPVGRAVQDPKCLPGIR